MSKVQYHAIILALVMILAFVCSKSLKSAGREGRVHTDFDRIPKVFGSWDGVELRFEEKTYEALPTCSLLLRDYVSDKHPSMVELAVVYGTDLGDFHQPEYCLEGQGLKRVKQGAVQMHDSSGKVFTGTSLIMDDGRGGRQAFVYWFYNHGNTGTYLGSVKVGELFYRMFGGKTEPSAMVRLSTDARDGDEKAIERLKVFGGMLFSYLESEFRSSGRQ